MDKCKFCQQELDEGSTVCPHCGKDNAETEQAAAAEKTEQGKQEAAQAEAPASEIAASEEKPAGNASAGEEKPAEDVPAGEEKPAEDAPAGEEKPAEKAPADEEAEPHEAREEPKQEKKKAGSARMTGAIVLVVVLAAVLIALIIVAMKPKTSAPETAEPTVQTAAAETVPAETVPPTVPADGNPEDATCKGTYTADEKALKDARFDVVATMAEYKLTNSQLQIYYWEGIRAFLSGNPYAAYMINMSQPLDVQPCLLAEGLTWQQFFLENALSNWQNYQAMAAEADVNKIPEDPDVHEFLGNLPGELKKQAEESGLSDVEALIAANMGPGTSLNDYVEFMKTFHRGYGYFTYFLEVADPDDAKIEAYYQEHQDLLEEGGISKDAKSVNVRHILITPEDTEAEDSWKDAEKKADDLLKQFRDGDKKEDSFAAMATEHSQDPGSQSTGGLYEGVVLGQMVPEFEQWCFDDNRKVGDTGVVKTDYGYHVMYYSGDQLIWKDQVRQLYLNEKTEELMQRNAATYPLNVDYSKILLGEPVAE